MLRFILKIWPALLPITIYLLWVFFLKKFFSKKDFIEGEIVGEKKPFSLQNRNFVIILYATLLLIIFSLIFTAIRQKPSSFVVQEGVIVKE